MTGPQVGMAGTLGLSLLPVFHPLGLSLHVTLLLSLFFFFLLSFFLFFSFFAHNFSKRMTQTSLQGGQKPQESKRSQKASPASGLELAQPQFCYKSQASPDST